ncbi:MAG: ABC transporter permease [Dehalococcoidia bacterium]|nr:ABC transporter permease [Dehalococcoidia bacterium]
MRELRGLYIIWYRDLLRFWRNTGRLLSSFIMPLLFLVIFGSGIASSMTGLMGGGGNFNYIEFMFPGIIGMVVLMAAIMSGVSIVWDREFGFLKEVMVAPMSRTTVAIGRTLGGATIATIQGVLMLVFIPFVHISVSIGQVLLILPLMFIMAFALTAMGILIASRIKSMETFQVIMQLLLFPMIFISPAMFPTEFLPSWLNGAVKINPVSYAIDSLRQALTTPPPGMPGFGMSLFGHPMSIAEDIAIVALFALIMVSLAVWSFGRQE